jgi:pyruvate,orthophosphate dikinase
LRIAREMVDEGLISTRTAVNRVVAEHLDQLLHPIIDPAGARAASCRLPRAPAPQRRAVFDPDAAERARRWQAVILVREETTPEDFHGIVAARAVLTRAAA